MPEREWFRDWFDSPFYHKLYFERDEEEAAAFLRRLVNHLHMAPGSRVLDVACGRGRHSKIFASMGFDVIGIDLSPASIAYAKRFENDNLQFFIHDMRLPFWANYFDWAFNFFTSFGYFRTRREHDAAIRTITRSLRTGGTLVMDYLNAHYVEEHLLPGITKHYNGTTYDIEKWDNESHFYKKIKISDASLAAPLEFTEIIEKFSLGDFTDMLSYHGMQIVEVFGDYELSKYDVKKTPRLIVVAKKTTGETLGHEH